MAIDFQYSTATKAEPWTDEADVLLRKGILEGLSRSQIAKVINAELGTNYSRNAVISRAHRKMPEYTTTKEHASALGATVSRIARSRFNGNGRTAARIAQIKSGLPRPTVSAPVKRPKAASKISEKPLNIHLLDLERHHCRFPYGERDFTYCGHTAAPGSAYCMHHKGVMYAPAVRRAKKIEIL